MGVVYKARDTRLERWIALKFLAPQSGFDREEKNRLLQEAVRIARQIAEGLDHAHRHGIIHRDIKPGNVMITAEGDAKMIDFGLAKLRDSTVSIGRISGTASYMSPEQASGDGGSSNRYLEPGRGVVRDARGQAGI